MCGAVFSFLPICLVMKVITLKHKWIYKLEWLKKTKMYEQRAQAEILAMEQKANKIKEDAARLKKKIMRHFLLVEQILIHHPMEHFLEG